MLSSITKILTNICVSLQFQDSFAQTLVKDSVAPRVDIVLAARIQGRAQVLQILVPRVDTVVKTLAPGMGDRIPASVMVSRTIASKEIKTLFQNQVVSFQMNLNLHAVAEVEEGGGGEASQKLSIQEPELCLGEMKTGKLIVRRTCWW